MELVLRMYNVHSYFSLTNFGKNVHYMWQNMVILGLKENLKIM